MTPPDIAVILPCFNEGRVIADVVSDFRSALPAARVIVFDNNSTDNTAEEAVRAGAIVRKVVAQGKGNVIRAAFARIDADIYVVADGDGTYDASQAPALVDRLLSDDLDMVVGLRRSTEASAYRRGHVLGNRLFNGFVRNLFARGHNDIFSGYRVLSRPFVKSFPALSKGFEIETEMSLHALQLQLSFAEVETAYRARAGGTQSKLKTYRDGRRILFYMLKLLKQHKPLFLFWSIAAFAAVVALIIGTPVIVEYLGTGLVPRLPTAVAAASVMVIAVISFVSGVILDSVAYANLEQKRLAYLSVPPYQTEDPWTPIQ